MNYLGDYQVGSTVRWMWNSNAVAGESITRATDGTIRIYKNNSTTERSSSAGITDTEDFDTLTGVHQVIIDLSDNTDADFYAAGNDYFIVLSGATIDGKAINAALGSFSIENRGQKAVHSGLAQAGGTSSITLASTAPSVDDSLNYQRVDIVGGTGAGQSAVFTDYNGTTKVGTVDHAWQTTPDSTSVYRVVYSRVPRDVSKVTGDVEGKVLGTTSGGGTISGAGVWAYDNAGAALPTWAKLKKWLQLLFRKDAAIATDNATELAEINANGGSGGGSYDQSTDSVEAIRDRGDAAWTTGGGGSGDWSGDWSADEKTAIKTILGVPATGTTPDTPTAGALKTINDKTTNLPGSPAAVGSAMTLADGAITSAKFGADAIDAAAVAATGAAEIAAAVVDQAVSGHTSSGTFGEAISNSATNSATILSRIGAFTGSGVNTILGFFKALMSKAASNPSDVGGTFDAATDSTEGIRDRGDAAWISANSDHYRVEAAVNPDDAGDVLVTAFLTLNGEKVALASGSCDVVCREATAGADAWTATSEEVLDGFYFNVTHALAAPSNGENYLFKVKITDASSTEYETVIPLPAV